MAAHRMCRESYCAGKVQAAQGPQLRIIFAGKGKHTAKGKRGPISMPVSAYRFYNVLSRFDLIVRLSENRHAVFGKEGRSGPSVHQVHCWKSLIGSHIWPIMQRLKRFSSRAALKAAQSGSNMQRLSRVLWSSELMSVIATMSTSVISLEKENEALRLTVQELERKAMRQEVKVQANKTLHLKVQEQERTILILLPRCGVHTGARVRAHELHPR